MSEQHPAADSQSIFDHVTVKAIAGAAALFLGLIYAYGAVIKAGELHGAGQAIGDTLPLVPLEQVLVLGINQMLPVGIALGVAVLIGIGWIDRTKPAKEKGAGTAKSGRWNPWVLRSLKVLTVASYIFLFFAASWTFWLLVAQLSLVSWYANSEHSTRQSYTLFASISVAIFFAATAWFNPNPLAHVEMKTHDGRTISGDLIATTGTTWYVGTKDKHWTAIQSRTIESVHVEAVKRDQNESAYHALTGHRLFDLGPE